MDTTIAMKVARVISNLSNATRWTSEAQWWAASGENESAAENFARAKYWAEAALQVLNEEFKEFDELINRQDDKDNH